ncbi:hypothetical protein MA16_Dca014180 [Dendrobium catenatum]|uniref:Uncharacterized protein n=1 Tax=Dendrobium catenatum TaxID=906689 RepID=A0A2I0VTL9_9ASPA|nr:hypothetical protein MA16_Dca014180 [Dendrobium catenatum]
MIQIRSPSVKISGSTALTLAHISLIMPRVHSPRVLLATCQSSKNPNVSINLEEKIKACNQRKADSSISSLISQSKDVDSSKVQRRRGLRRRPGESWPVGSIRS